MNVALTLCGPCVLYSCLCFSTNLCLDRAAEALVRRKQEEEELRKRRQLEHQRAEEALAVQSDPRMKTWMDLVRVCLLFLPTRSPL